MSILELKNLSIEFPIYKTKSDSSFVKKMMGLGREKSYFRALNNINLSFDSGDRVALIGKNGAGKSTALRVMAGLLPPSSGLMKLDGDIFPALQPAPGVLHSATCIQNIILQGLLFGFAGSELTRYVSQVCEFSRLGDFINSPYSTLSAGMKGRFSVATLNQVSPDILLMDEWIGTADKQVLDKSNGLLTSLVDKSRVFVLASHREALLKSHCNKAVVFDAGAVVYQGDVDSALKEFKQ